MSPSADRATETPPLRFVVLCQEEPVFLGPVLVRVLEARPQDVAAVVIAGRRSAGEKRKTWRDRWASLRTFWLVFEPLGFVGSLVRRVRARLLGSRDPTSVEGAARRLGIAFHHAPDRKSPEFAGLLRSLAPDVILNQSEILLTTEVLAVPRVGFLNRHASLLPRFRGRMGAFRAHAADPPSYGVTIHLVDEGIDTGAIVLQEEVRDVDPRWPYPRVMRRLCDGAPALIWRAVDLLAKPGFAPLSNRLPPGAPAEPVYVFPTLDEARAYHTRMASRRAPR